MTVLLATHTVDILRADTAQDDHGWTVSAFGARIWTGRGNLQLDPPTAELPGGVDRDRLLHGLGAWALVFGMISFELFGTFHNTFDDAEPLFRYQVDLMASHLGLRP